MDSNDADFFARKNRDRLVNRLKSFDMIECFSEKEKKMLPKRNMCPDLQRAMMVCRCKKTNTLETDETEDYRTILGNKREKVCKIVLDFEKSSDSFWRNGYLYINCDIMKSMHMKYKIDKDNLLSYGYKGLATGNTSKNCFNSMHLDDEHHGEQDNCSFLKKVPPVRK